MAKREIVNKMNQDIIRSKIQAAKIINVMQAFALGTAIKQPNGKTAVPKMTPTRLNAMKTLLGKVIPDLKSEELVALIENTQKVISAAPVTEEDWIEKHSDNVVKLESKGE